MCDKKQKKWPDGIILMHMAVAGSGRGICLLSC